MAIAEGLRQRNAAAAADKLQQDAKRKVVSSAQFAQKWEKPQFTIKDVRDAIPAHCFKRSTLHSFAYVAYDVTLMSILFYAATHISSVESTFLRALLWPLYWVCQGVIMTGIWVIAHECGHQAFSDKSWINNAVGYVLHTFLLVPYYSWKFSHAKHHAKNAHMTKDQVFVPNTRNRLAAETGVVPAAHELPSPPSPTPAADEESIWDDAPIADLISIVAMLTVGWPLYLLRNASGQRFPEWTSHFKPSSRIFEPRQWKAVLISNIGLLIMLGVLGTAVYLTSFSTVFFYYVVPYLNVNAWLVTITYLQHTDPRIPHFNESEWTFLLGALSTIDRDYGFLLNHFFHHIQDTHVAHHLFSTMPHYHAQEATEALKKFLGPYYMKDDTPVWKSLWKSYTNCRFVEDEGGVLWYKQ
ncbi:hypothetical protein HDU85_002072 [Gaertneriomyces sp. JEL0708]|nr:hypothetical protein HDU85_002072 [Gaertneriomyces sp. JEL0708]